MHAHMFRESLMRLTFTHVSSDRRLPKEKVVQYSGIAIPRWHRESVLQQRLFKNVKVKSVIYVWFGLKVAKEKRDTHIDTRMDTRATKITVGNTV